MWLWTRFGCKLFGIKGIHWKRIIIVLDMMAGLNNLAKVFEIKG